MFVYRPIRQNVTSVTCHLRNATKKKCIAKKGIVTEYVTAFHFCCCCFCCCCYYCWLPFTSRHVAVKSTSHLPIWYWEESRLKTWWLYKIEGMKCHLHLLRMLWKSRAGRVTVSLNFTWFLHDLLKQTSVIICHWYVTKTLSIWCTWVKA